MVHYGKSLLSTVQASSKRETEIIWGELKILNKVRSVLGFWKPGRIWESQKEGESILVYSGYLLLHNKTPQHSHLKQLYSFLLLMNLQLGSSMVDSWTGGWERTVVSAPCRIIRGSSENGWGLESTEGCMSMSWHWFVSWDELALMTRAPTHGLSTCLLGSLLAWRLGNKSWYPKRAREKYFQFDDLPC